MHLLLLGPIPTECERYIREYVTTPWTIAAVRDTTDRAAVTAALRDADALLTVSFEADMTHAAAKLKLLMVPGAGVDAVQRDALPPRCAVTNVYEHAIPIAEYVMLNVLLHATQQNHYAQTMRQGRWDGSGRHFGAFHGEVFGQTLGIIGYGHIGQVVAARAKAFGMRTLAVRRTPRDDEHLDFCGSMDDLDRVLAESDYVVIACPLTEATRGLIGEEQFQLMNRSAFLINVARGPIADERALFAALKNRKIAGAALDAWYDYPADLDTVMHGSSLPFHELDNVVLTPHFSAWTEAMIRRRMKLTADNLDRLHAGRPLLRVVYDGVEIA